MKWENFVNVHKEYEAIEKDDVTNYILIKVFDTICENGLAVAATLFVIFFGIVGLFLVSGESKINWSLHAAELSLGVLLGLLKKKS